MELRRLRYFVAVADEAHFRRASERLGVAQPALSRQIRTLEDELGVELFERLPRGVRLSDAGRIFLEDARRIVDEIDGAIERVQRFSSGLTGRLRVAFSEAVSGHPVVTEAIRTFRDAEPDVELILQSIVSTRQIESLNAGEIDAGFAYRTPHVSHDIRRFEIDVLTLLAALPEAHALAKEPVLNLAQIANGPLICVDRNINPPQYEKLMSVFAERDLVPRIVQEADSAVVVNLVAAGMGIGLISSAMRSRLPRGVIVKPVTDLTIATPFGLVWKDENKSRVLLRFIDTVATISDRSTRTA